MTEDPSTSGSGAEPGQQPQPAQPEVAPGWYPHPTAPGWEAYWTGSGWGTETRPAPAPAAPAGAEQAAAQPAAQPAAQEPAQPAAQETATTSPEPVTQAAPVTAGAAAGPRTAGPPAADRADSSLPAILCALGALVAVVGAFLPQAKLDAMGVSADIADNTMVAAGYGIAVIAAAVIGAAIAVWAYLKAARTWLPILLGAVIVAIAVYAGTAGLDVTLDFPITGMDPDDADPSTGIFAVGAGGLLMILGGIGLARESR